VEVGQGGDQEGVGMQFETGSLTTTRMEETGRKALNGAPTPAGKGKRFK